jgi:glutamate 5-kinase
MITKISGGPRAAGSGASTVIAWGREPDALLRLWSGENPLAPCWWRRPRKSRPANNGWPITCSCAAPWWWTTARRQVRDEGKSLLPIGMTAVEGDFSRGDVIAVRSGQGREIARGLANYSSAEARLICRKPSSEFERCWAMWPSPKCCTGTTSSSRASGRW